MSGVGAGNQGPAVFRMSGGYLQYCTDGVSWRNICAAADMMIAHTHPEGEVVGLVADMAGKAATSHTHAESDITGLVADLAGKSPTSHAHAQSDVTGLATSLAGKAAVSHTHTVSELTDFAAGLTALGYKKPVSYTFTATLSFSLLTGVQIVNSTVTGILTTDLLVECQPVSDLPNNLSVAWVRISANDTLRIAFSTPTLLTFSGTRDFRVTVLR